jgi:hypothetical protein
VRLVDRNDSREAVGACGPGIDEFGRDGRTVRPDDADADGLVGARSAVVGPCHCDVASRE